MIAWGIATSGAMALVFALSPENDDDALVRRTADVAVGWWAIAAGLLLKDRREQARAVWIWGCLAYVVHVAVAFDRAHSWSHAAAMHHVEEASGFGPGIFVSHAFGLLWLIDSLWWLFAWEHYERRSVALDRGLHGFFAFIVFNGTVVYEAGWIRWAGMAVFAVLACLWMFRLRKLAAIRPI